VIGEARRPRWRELTVRDEASGQSTLTVRPLTIMELVDAPFVVLRENFRTLVLLAGLALVPLELAGTWFQRRTFGGFGLLQLLDDPVAAEVAFETADTGFAQALVLQGIASVTVYAVLGGLIARVAVSSVLGERLGPAEAVRSTLRRWPALMGLALLAGAAVFGLGGLALLLFVFGGLPGAVLGGLLLLAALPVGVAAHVLLLPAPVIVAVEGAGVVAAVRRSVRLVRRRFWAVLGAVVLVMIVSGLVQSALATLPTIGTFLVGFDSGWLLAAAGAIGAGIVVTPYTTLFAALVYLDGRARTEALDVEILADQALEGFPAAG
jgi:hypothetical protein